MSYATITLNPGSGGAEVRVDRVAGEDTNLAKILWGVEGTHTPVGTGTPLPTQGVSRLIVASASAMARPANTTAYAAGDAVANDATAGSVTPISLTVSDLNDAPVSIERLRIASSDTGVAGRVFRAWLFRSSPTPDAGDNAAFTVPAANLIGTMIGVFKSSTTSGSFAVLVPEDGQRIVTVPGSGAQTVFALLQTLDAFTPSANSTTFTLTAEGEQGRA
jgi:hypothetical protein